MTGQSSLFPDPLAEDPGAARITDPPTSQGAALLNPGARARLRGRILELFFEDPYRMRTDEELTVALDERYPAFAPHHHASVVRRRGELVDRRWLCSHPEHSPEPLTRPTSHHAPAIVWCLSAAAKTDGWTVGWTDDESNNDDP